MATAALLESGIPIPLSIVLGVAAGGLAGFVNGVLINYVNIPAFIATLGMLYIARGIVVFLTNSLPIAPLPGEFNVIGQGSLLGLPYLVFYAVIIGVTVHVLLEYSGSAPRSARSAAIARRPRTWASTCAGFR